METILQVQDTYQLYSLESQSKLLRGYDIWAGATYSYRRHFQYRQTHAKATMSENNTTSGISGIQIVKWEMRLLGVVGILQNIEVFVCSCRLSIWSFCNPISHWAIMLGPRSLGFQMAWVQMFFPWICM